MSNSIILSLLLCSLSLIILGAEGAKVKNPHKPVPPAPKGPKLESKAVLEPGCMDAKPVNDLKPEFINKAPAWYVPIASKYFYYHWGEALINRSLGASEMPQLCMKWLFLAPTTPKGKYNVIVGGYHHAVTQLCMDTGFVQETCEAVKGSPGYHKGADNVGTIVATDNQRWFLMSRCVQKKYRDWAIFVADRQPLDSALYKKILVEIKNKGFDLKNVENAKYEKCSKKV